MDGFGFNIVQHLQPRSKDLKEFTSDDQNNLFAVMTVVFSHDKKVPYFFPNLNEQPLRGLRATQV